MRGADQQSSTQYRQGAPKTQAVTLLQAYLAAPRARDLDAELRARRSLGAFYLDQKQWEQARAVLTFDAPGTEDKVAPGVRSKLRDIEALRARLKANENGAK